jgi:enoyl-CoA hydratase/carnithine racemase
MAAAAAGAEGGRAIDRRAQARRAKQREVRVTTVHIADEGPLGRLTRNRPDKLTALSNGLHAEPGATLDAPCRLRRGAGRSAAAGPNPTLRAANRRKRSNPPIEPMATHAKPVIAAVNGIAAGANIAPQEIGPAPGAP